MILHFHMNKYDNNCYGNIFNSAVDAVATVCFSVLRILIFLEYKLNTKRLKLVTSVSISRFNSLDLLKCITIFTSGIEE